MKFISLNWWHCCNCANTEHIWVDTTRKYWLFACIENGKCQHRLMFNLINWSIFKCGLLTRAFPLITCTCIWIVQCKYSTSLLLVPCIQPHRVSNGVELGIMMYYLEMVRKCLVKECLTANGNEFSCLFSCVINIWLDRLAYLERKKKWLQLVNECFMVILWVLTIF